MKENKNSRRLELRISNFCARRCIFCCERDNIVRANHRFMPLAQAVGILRDGRREGFGHVTFVGGEGTLHPDFCAIAGWARAWAIKYSFPPTDCALPMTLSRNAPPRFLTRYAFRCTGPTPPQSTPPAAKKGFSAPCQSSCQYPPPRAGRLYNLQHRALARQLPQRVGDNAPGA